ncbi:iron-sulfur cluster scaffold-like protein [Rubrobacter aplysinae]|uniref:iron-sulfur cluster scaffold-like protein n=1 Tax=Rubrobacter aplysinae TaxID=909625 RepID=UPI00064C1E0A|nr:iron-sulfur cluster scaffold-like protein [Rubrobacter aplysinae]
MSEAYGPEVLRHLVSPANVGEIEDADGTGESGHMACGDVARFTVRVRDNVVEEARFKVQGCAATIAAGSALAGLASGAGILEAARISRSDVEDELGGPLPEGKEHATMLVVDALHKAFENRWDRVAGESLVEGYGGY